MAAPTSPTTFPRPEQGICVDASEDGSRVPMALDCEHAKELATIIANLSVSRDDYGAWLEVVRTTADGTWLGALLRHCKLTGHTWSRVPSD